MSVANRHAAPPTAGLGHPVRLGRVQSESPLTQPNSNSPRHRVDPAFTDLPLRTLADAALSAATGAGASFADFRFERLRHRRPDHQGHRRAVGDRRGHHRLRGPGDRGRHLGFRGVGGRRPPTRRRAPRGRPSRWPGRWPGWSPSGWSGPTSRSTGDRNGSAATTSTRSPSPAQDKIALLLDRSERLLASDGVAHTTAGLFQVKENKFYADTAGTVTTQQRVRLQPSLTATAVDSDDRRVRDDVQPDPAGRPRVRIPDRRHLGLRCRDRHDGRAALGEDQGAVDRAPGRYDLVIDPTNLWLTIHESIGHATEYDRAIGYEAAYAGTSFATPDKLGSLVYGSPIMNVTGDRTVDARAGDDRIRRRRGRRPVVEPDHRRHPHRLPARPGLRPPAGPGPVERLRARRFAGARPDPADGQRQPAARPGRRIDRRPDRRDRRRHLRGRRQVVVDRHAALQLPVHRPAVLPDQGRRAGRPGAGRRLPGDHHRLLGRDGRGRRPADLPAGRRLQLRQGSTRSGRRRLARLPVGPVPRHLDSQHRAGGSRDQLDNGDTAGGHADARSRSSRPRSPRPPPTAASSWSSRAPRRTSGGRTTR